MKSLVEIEKAIAQLPKKSQQQLLRDLPTLCPKVFPSDGWDAILADTTPRPGLSLLLDQLDAEYKARPEKFANIDFAPRPCLDKQWAVGAESCINAFELGKLKAVPAATVLAYRGK